MKTETHERTTAPQALPVESDKTCYVRPVLAGEVRDEIERESDGVVFSDDQLLYALHARFPALRFAIHEEATLDLQDGLRSGRLDAAISTRGDHPDMDALPLFEEALFIGVAPDDPLADPLSGAGAPIRVEALAGRQLLALGTRHRLGLLVRELASRAGAHVSADYQGTSLDAVRMMAEMGGAVAVMPSLYARQEAARDPGIVLRRVDDPAARRSVALFWRPGFPAPAKLRTVGGVMADMAASLLEGDSA